MRMGTRLGLIGATALATVNCGGQQLGPRDGHDLPAIELDRVAVGTEAPDFSLRSLSGDVVTLSDFRDEQKVLLVFYRGHW